MTLIQTHLQCGDTHLTTFFPKDPRVKIGKRISLDKDDTIWTVVKQYDSIESSEIKRGWDNNY